MATFLERYQAGDRTAVWDDLVALREEVRHKRYYADTVAVAAETMRRVLHNVDLLIRRLDDMGYCFLTMDVRGRCEGQAMKLFLRTQEKRALKLHPGDAIIPLTSKELRSGMQATAINLARKASSGKPP